jgi:outer membrane protein OmpA-like peptidoglycan-associated protein
MAKKKLAILFLKRAQNPAKSKIKTMIHKLKYYKFAKNIKIVITALVVFSAMQTHAQIGAAVNQVTSKSYFQLTPRVAADLPNFKNNTPFIKYKAGLGVGLSADYYWGWFGLGADVDYIKNRTQSTFPTGSLVNAASVPLTSFSIVENPVTRIFYGIGPSFKYQSNSGKFTTELNTRVGLASLKGGYIEHRETNTSLKELLNFHAGYNAKNVLSSKIQLRSSYYFNSNWGVNAGAYLLQHYKVLEIVDPILGFSAKYIPLNTATAPNTYSGAAAYRVQPCNCTVQSIGVFVGITYKFGKRVKNNEVCLPEYSLAVTATDKYTNELLPFTEVKVKNKAGEVVQTGITNSYGVVVFEKMMPEDYSIEGTLANVGLDAANATKAEFLRNANKVVQKKIVFGDRNFVIKGKIFECNSTKTIPGITVVLENLEQAFKKTTITDAEGNYVLQLPATGVYSLYGKMDKYFSQIEEVTANKYNRDKNLFIKLEICAEPVDCGKAINLKNILFDLDKYVIKEEAKPELNKLVRFMKDNPTVRVEVGSHTDCRSSAEYNQTLSQNRANASVDYVVSQGIARNRITGKGYGESKLLNECADGVNCTEAQHSINRRTEMKVICNN